MVNFGITGSRPDQPIFPCLEWSIVDDVLNISDTASVTVANPKGELTNRFKVGQKIEIDLSDDLVAGGRWIRSFTGRITRVRKSSSIQSGTVIMITAQDLGWHLTSCHAPPLLGLTRTTLVKLIKKLIDPTWGFAKAETSGDLEDNTLNRYLKQGRAGVQRAINPQLGAVLPYIQVEPGQTPFDILRTYLAREGLLLNVGARGQLVLFRPEYNRASPYSGIEFHADNRRIWNNVVGSSAVEESIDGYYSEAQCWSTVVMPPPVDDNTNPNAQYRKSVTTAIPNPLPFERLHVFSDGEAINEEMRERRAVFKLQFDAFNSWQYTADLVQHSQNGAFFTSDELMPVNDSVNEVNGLFYIQRVQRSFTLQGGTRTSLVLRKPILNPTLTAQVGTGAKKAAKK